LGIGLIKEGDMDKDVVESPDEAVIRILQSGPSGKDDWPLSNKLIESGMAKGKVLPDHTRPGNHIYALHWQGSTLQGDEYCQQLSARTNAKKSNPVGQNQADRKSHVDRPIIVNIGANTSGTKGIALTVIGSLVVDLRIQAQPAGGCRFSALPW
jgi:hypothetical protein